MTVQKSSEFKGFGFNYDPLQQPFFKVLCKENLHLLAALKIGKRLLKAIEDARPSFRVNTYPAGVNVVLQPPLNKQWSTPGLGAMSGRITDQQKFDNFAAARNPTNLQVDPTAGKLIPGISAKTSLQEDNKKAASDGTGSTATLFYSNTEILSDTGTWFIPHVTMGHELIHCLHSLRGEMDPDNKVEEYTTVGIKGYDYEFTENKIRQEAGYPQRTKYFADD
jgi:hypothetical protein